VKRRTLVLTVIAGLLVFLAVLVLNLPASWFASLLPSQVRCAELGGSIWHGECLRLEFQGNSFGDASWNLAPGAAFRGHLTGDVDVRGGALTLTADIDTNFLGVGELRNVKGQFPMDPTFIAQLPRDQRGRISADLKRVVIGASGAPAQIAGTLELHDLRQLRDQPADLGSFQLTFDGSARPDGGLVGKLKDLGGPFLIEGTVTLTPPNAFEVQGFITGRSAEAERAAQIIALNAPAEASGRRPFGFAGTY
jgi:hypothetical protein